MRRILTAAIAALCLSTVAARADDPAWNHGGLYLGLAGGYSTTALKAEDMKLAGEGAFGGALLGYGIVTNGLYMGIEVDGTLRDIKPALSDGTTTVSFSNAWMATGRGRLGLVFGPALLYGTAGVAVTESKLAATDFGSDKLYSVGFVGGGGIELITFKNLAIRLEALHYAMPAETFSIQGVEATVKQSETVARAAVTFKLN